jgi:hypothetical protein
MSSATRHSRFPDCGLRVRICEISLDGAARVVRRSRRKAPSPALTVDGNLAVGKGSARILATSKKIVCTAFLADPSGTPPVSMGSLTIIAKTKQKAAN